jgi:alkylation response protein AidB-like acyl-CoA dehydrogenase
MRFALTPEQEAFRDTARRFLSERVDLRATIDRTGAHDPALWKAIASLGWFGVDVPEELAGQGLTFVEVALLAEETGRALLPGPFLETLLAVQALLVAGSDQQRADHLPSLVAGERPTAAVRGAGISLLSDRLRGEDRAVPCAEVAELFLVAAAVPDGMTPFLVNRDQVTVEPAQGADLTRPIARVVLDRAKYLERLDARRFAGLVDRARVIVAAELAGAASRALEMAVAYAMDRQQFGRPIGEFQAVKHRAADSWRAAEAARLAVWYAAWAIANDAPDASVAASAAKAAAGDAALKCTADSIQIHGGIGFTWEHDAHLYYRRAIAGQAALGDSSVHREALAADVFSRA